MIRFERVTARADEAFVGPAILMGQGQVVGVTLAPGEVWAVSDLRVELRVLMARGEVQATPCSLEIAEAVRATLYRVGEFGAQAIQRERDVRTGVEAALGVVVRELAQGVPRVH